MWFVVVVVVKVSGLRGCGGKVVAMEMRCSSAAGAAERHSGFAGTVCKESVARTSFVLFGW